METQNQNNPHNNNVYPNNTYPVQPIAATAKQEDNVYTKKLKEHFPFFGIGSALYALFYTFCLYKNASGITYPFFVIGTLYYFFFSMRKIGIPYKKDSLFYIVSIVLLGISNCLTNSESLLFMNKCGIFLLSFILIIHTINMDKNWNFPEYLAALVQTAGTVFSCILRPFSDMVFYFDVKKSEQTGKQSYLLPILIGIAITIPILIIMTIWLIGADNAVFGDMLVNLFSMNIFVDVGFWTIVVFLDSYSEYFGSILLAIVVFFGSYAVYAALSTKNVKDEVTDYRVFEPVTAIIVTATLSALYLIFSMVQTLQILLLFIGKIQFSSGYTDSYYAKNGFFELLMICILNLIIVLVCRYLFRENTALKVILTIISGCTFIMILSCVLRMMTYINSYNLTFSRIFALWTLAVIFLLMVGVTIFIYKSKFPLFTYSLIIVTVFYISLSFARPDYWIAKYNLDPVHLDYLDKYDVYDSQYYLSTLSADAAPILLNEETNPYLRQKIDDEELAWVRLSRYRDRIDDLSENMHIRNFNLSIYMAGKYVE